MNSVDLVSTNPDVHTKKSNEIMKEYEQHVQEDKIDNSLPNDGSLPYEAQLLHDLTSSLRKEYNQPNGRDEYGYTHNQYNQYGLQQTPVVQSSPGLVSFFKEVNNFNFN